MYDKLFNNILNPFYESVIKNRKTYHYLKELINTQYHSTKSNNSKQIQSLQNLINHAQKNCPYYSGLLRETPLASPNYNFFEQEFKKIPFLTKEIINLHRDRLVATNYKNELWSKSTGGSTGTPLHFYYTKDSNDWRVACTWRGYGWAGCYPGVKQGYIWGSHVGNVSKFKLIKENLHHILLRQKYFNCFQFTEQIMETTLSELNKFKPHVIVGYTNPLYNFAKYIKNSNHSLKFKPKSIITAAEALHDFQRILIEDVFGCKIYHTYGSREFMLIASECEQHAGLHINIENIFLEIVKADGSQAAPGEIGEIVITDLHNYGMPFIRYKIGDLGILSDKECPCGRGLPLLEKVVGRSLDMLKTPDGRFVPGEFFPHLLKEFQEIEQFQVVQNKFATLDIYLVMRAGQSLNPHSQSALEQEIAKVMGTSIAMHYHFVSDIPLTQTGKHRVTICNI